MTASFDNTVGVLVRAYLAGTLNEMDCAACAVGNMVAAANNWTVQRGQWLTLRGTVITPSWKLGVELIGGRQAASTGYDNAALERIEDAFMKPWQFRYETKDERDFAALMLVVDVLADIHGVDLATATAAKALFVHA